MGASVDDSVHVDDNFFLFARLYTVQRGFQNLSVVLYVGDLGRRQKLKRLPEQAAIRANAGLPATPPIAAAPRTFVTEQTLAVG